ncbi:hypothetical protein AVEN_209817-1 [Araneus ventricosus]|uniref:Uncharacterized protein n=1 Tax=Araneus ventricosus TaxID=182803 RepID=A0A4Y2TL42_ARAVE|nr:hypothetical protein AVEN_58986-1 [Araneus ventricosus]GBO01288.1 hypothetical protein AVEN_209817-1 [Araneus ventricosus]
MGPSTCTAGCEPSCRADRAPCRRADSTTLLILDQIRETVDRLSVRLRRFRGVVIIMFVPCPLNRFGCRTGIRYGGMGRRSVC